MRPDAAAAQSLAQVAASIRERVRAVLAVAVEHRSAHGATAAVEGAIELLGSGGPEGLGDRFRLDATTEAILCLALAPDLAPDLGPAFAYLGERPARRPSLALALALIQPDAPLDLGRLATLRARGLADVRPHDSEPVGDAALTPAAGLVGHLLGAPELPDGVTRAPCPRLPLEPALPALDALGATLLHLHGSDPTALHDRAGAIAAHEDRELLVVDGAPDGTLLPGLCREATLRDALVLLVGLDPDGPPVDVHGLPLPVLCAGASPRPPRAADGGRVVSLAIAAPESAERAAIWRAFLPAPLTDEAQRLGARFTLALSAIDAAVDDAHGRAAAGDREPTIEDVLEGARAQTGAELDRLAPRVEVRPRWGELVLPSDARAQLEELVARVEARELVVGTWGFGRRRVAHPTTALFVGPSGTGKSMAAEAVAERLGLPLHRIDLSRVVSKYIGETEQQLDAIFDAASRTTAILFFDEADALFGKRSEVRDAHDRYANLEVSYLLQRMEQHDGVALLATNLAANMDEAFARRLDFTIHFPFPHAAARRELWERAWPAETPRDLDASLDELADRYELSGGNIRNVAVAAAYLAAGNGGVVTAEHVRHAIGREFQKLGAAVEHAPAEVGG